MKRPLSLVICLLLPIIILVMGLFFGAVFGYREIPPLFEESGKGLANPKVTMTLPEPGKYTVWLYTYTLFEGTAYEASDRLPDGAKVHVFDTGDRTEIALSKWTSAPKSLGNETAVSLGTFETLRPTVDVLMEGARKPLVLSVAPTNLPRVMSVVLTLVGILVATLFLSIVTLIILLHRRQRQIQLMESA